MKRLPAFKEIFFPFLLVAVNLLIAFQNFTPGTWLTGWDTLHPEFNLPLNLYRVIMGVWRTDQGLGAVAAHAHMSELPRIFLMWATSLVLPLSMLRYAYVFLCLILGPLGVYTFLRRSILKHTSLSTLIAFFGALIYLFNLGTVQHFYVPFEMFPTQYAALGWLFWLATSYLQHSNKKALLLFGLISFLATPMAYAPLLWYAYFAGFMLFLGAYWIGFRKKIIVRRSIVLVVVGLIVNSFWLLPNWYFLFTHAAEVPLAKTNRLFSEEAFLHNKQFGTFTDTAILKNFLFNWAQYDNNGHFQQILTSWRTHLEQPLVPFIGYAIFLLVIGGILVAIRRKNRLQLALLPLVILSFVMLTNMNPPFELVFGWLREHISLFKEGLRFPFTKFSILLLFGFSIYASVALEELLGRLKHLAKKAFPIILGSIFILICGSLIYYSWPMFNGQLIDPKMRIAIPSAYFDMFRWFDEQSVTGRVANLPLHSMWGWEYYDWGYQGAGFLWFGIKYPVLARDFDRWNAANEQYYKEMSTALYSGNPDLLIKTAQKYQISYIIYDQHIITPGDDPKVLIPEQTLALLEKSSAIHLAQSFDEKLSVYTVDIPPHQSFIKIPTYTNTVGPGMLGTYEDPAYTTYSDYINSPTPNYWYPWRSLMDRTEELDNSRINLDGNILSFTLSPPFTSTPSSQSWNDSLAFPGILYAKSPDELEIKSEWLQKPVSISLPQTGPLAAVFNQTQVKFISSLNNGDESFGEVYLHPNTNEISYFLLDGQTKLITPTAADLKPYLCGPSRPNQVYGVTLDPTNRISLTSQLAHVCADMPMYPYVQTVENVDQLLLKIQFKSDPLASVCFYDTRTGKCLDATEEQNDTIRSVSRAIKSIDIGYTFLRFRFNGERITSTTSIAFDDLSLTTYYPTSQTFSFGLEKQLRSPLTKANSGMELQLPVQPVVTQLANEPLRATSCGDQNAITSTRIVKNDYVSFKAVDGASCDYVPFPNLSHNTGLLMTIEAKNVSGLPTRVCVTNHTTRKCDLYVPLADNPNWTTQHFVIPPTGEQSGYDVHFNTVSIGNIVSQNDIRKLTLTPIPYNWLTNLVLANPQAQPTTTTNSSPQVFLNGAWDSFLYTARVLASSQQNLMLNQAYDPGWIAFAQTDSFPFLSLLPQHSKANNWANAWKLDTNTGASFASNSIIIIYLPQLLELGGIGLLLSGIIIALLKRNQPKL